LADILGVEVHGTNHLLYDAHYDDGGFRDVWRFLLVGSRDLQATTGTPEVIPPAERWPRALDIDALPAVMLAQRTSPCPTRVATVSAARELLQLVRRDAGGRMAGLLATPMCELALPSVTAGAYHIAHVLLDGEFVRFYPDGDASPGVVYPVHNAYRLRRIVEGLIVIGVSYITR
jgi:hypothetical protein